jgi:hypothetical protein
MKNQIENRLEYLREQIRGECISYGEIVEGSIPKDDVELLQWAGVEEVETETQYVIYSKGEDAYWHNEEGWVDEVDPGSGSSMIFSESQKAAFTLPIAEGVVWEAYHD